MLKKTPYRKRQILALLLLLISGLGLVSCLILKNTYPEVVWLFVLEHGWEGGLIGGLCDWFAVWKTYSAIEKDSEVVADEIGKWVAKDLLNQETLRNQISQILEDPNIQKQIIKILDTYFDTHENTKKVLDKIWDKIKDPAKQYLVNYKFNLKEIQIITETTHDQIILETIKLCIGDTLVFISQEPSFLELVNIFTKQQNQITKLLLFFINIPEIIKGYGEKLKQGQNSYSEEEKYIDELVTLVSLSMDQYILAWEKLSITQKTQAVEALLAKVQELVGNFLAKFILEHKEYLRTTKTLIEYPPIRETFSLLESRIDQNVSFFIGTQISNRLKSQDPIDFRKKIEWQTRNVLENIRINGTILGFLLGVSVGLVQVLLNNYF